jgi:hypothetical protein
MFYCSRQARRFAGILALCAMCSPPLARAKTQNVALLLFGGANHKTFLGCLNCARFDSSSVCNRLGEFGSRFSDTSIWNRFSDYGNRFANTGAWNRLATDPPVIVDRDGSSYGYFTANRYYPSRTKIRAFLAFLDNVDDVNADLQKARDAFCGE